MKKTWLVAFGLAVGLLTLASSGMAARTQAVIDMAGRQVTVPFDPARIVCIGPGALRLMVYLQAVSKVVGVEDMEKSHPGGRPYLLAHPELTRLPRCGPGGPVGINKKPDLEAVLAVKPQVIFATYMDAALADEVQRTLNIPLVVLSYGAFATFDETVYEAMRIAGKVLNRARRAEEIVSYIEALREDLRRRTGDIPEDSRPAVYVGGIGYRGAHGIESTEQCYMPFDWIGADNVAKQVQVGIGSHVAVGKETLLKLNPDVIFIDGGGLPVVTEDYRKKPAFYKALKAFSSGRVYILQPFNWYATNIGTALADAYAIGKILHAQRFEEIDAHQKADEIYTFLVGKPVYEHMQQNYGSLGGKAPLLN